MIRQKSDLIVSIRNLTLGALLPGPMILRGATIGMIETFASDASFGSNHLIFECLMEVIITI